MASELESMWREPQLSEPFRVQQLFIELLTELHNEQAARKEQTLSWLDQALLYIETHYHKDLTREQLADIANISPEHFSRMFRKHTGRTFNAHLTLLRIRSAQRSILSGAPPDLNTLAQEVGYKEGSYLSRRFKELTGLSPTAYQQKTKRIVALNFNHTASLMALGIIPDLGVYTPWLENTQSSKTIHIDQKLNPYEHTPSAYYKVIAAARPDVIISYSKAKENKSLLPLAPVLELPHMTMNWREQFRLIADMVGRRHKAEDRLAEYDELLGQINQKLDHELGNRGTAIVWEIGPKSAYCFSSNYGRGCQILYDDIGFRPPSQLLDQGIAFRGYIEAEIESIASYPADHIFITDLPSYPSGQQRINRLFRSRKWANLEAVRHNRVYLLNQPEMFYGYDPISSQAQLKELLKALT
ncbi:hypothetical protein KCTCHS21_03480 [Cohnella abietis]|uniref:Fe3+-hydroxamate ABC transporter substrate-binding protein n=1 Tax=Cohnella abietis TaxID=2507935 RepID=A0A3T1CYV3_9BACL|nr:hypothetical protein KCTCHS21_03480 [Cohnella abietis]